MEDLEKKRDEVCGPLSKTILTEISTDLVNSKDNHKGLVMKTLALMLDANLNVTTEVSYIPQLLLRNLSGLNAMMQSCTLIPTDEERCGDVANKILALLATQDIDTTLTDKDEIIKQYEPLKEKLNQLFSDENVTELELDHIKDMIFNSFTSFNNTLLSSIEEATEKAQLKSFGIEFKTDLTLKKLDEFLLS
jgi:hypothetical protein